MLSSSDKAVPFPAIKSAEADSRISMDDIYGSRKGYML
jgi:hypothetical protein